MLTSIWLQQQDAPLIKELIDLHLTPHTGIALEDAVIVDTTYGENGNFWSWMTRNYVIKLDADITRARTACANYKYLPFKDNSIDVLCWDPPHIPDAGKPRPKFMQDQYSIVYKVSSIAGESQGFIPEALRVLKPNGIIICKITDQIQSGRRHWQHYEFMNTCFQVGLTVCDLVIKIRPVPTSQPRDYQLHTRQRHSFFFVVRKGKC